MPKGVRLKPEQAVAKLREIEVKLGQGKDVLKAYRDAGVTDKSYSWSAPIEWSRWNVSSELAFSLVRAWPAELVGVAQPATRPMQVRTPRVQAACSRGPLAIRRSSTGSRDPSGRSLRVLGGA